MWSRLVSTGGLFFLHDNAWLHVAQPALLRLNKFGNKTQFYPTYSPNLSAAAYQFSKHLHIALPNKVLNNKGYAKNAFNAFVTSREEEFPLCHMNIVVFGWQKCAY